MVSITDASTRVENPLKIVVPTCLKHVRPSPSHIACSRAKADEGSEVNVQATWPTGSLAGSYGSVNQLEQPEAISSSINLSTRHVLGTTNERLSNAAEKAQDSMARVICGLFVQQLVEVHSPELRTSCARTQRQRSERAHGRELILDARMRMPPTPRGGAIWQFQNMCQT